MTDYSDAWNYGMTFYLVPEMQLAFPDAAALADLFDLYGFTATDIQDFYAAFAAMRERFGPSEIEFTADGLTANKGDKRHD